ncbi:hypothetical protein EDF58_106297 [Novosphingobium sp. PhB57]|jgi:hypothetical protein|uniref:hypothetical protein n=1 Tax=unclassified Novosphingobium TaxID=2644732 RepID=UPI001047C885|nr:MULTISPECIES: hypothetical protein [unclassified Novosphingobium]TCU56006.1 hypothetical protein EDF58_106297 [Novosphingobium sp. PhB57]TDW65144.1 hypothetical protein EDF57_103322 [Novosphingobium sp. PhB55]
MTSLIGRTAWIAILALAAIVAVGVEMDREGRRNFAVAQLVARFVPASLQSSSLESLAHEAYDSGDAARGVALSQAFVRRRPVPSEGLALLAYGQLQKGEQDAALRSVVLAGDRGWRDRFTQETLVMLALQAEEWSIAAQRTVALWRIGLNDDRLKDMTADLLSRPQGVDAFAAQVGQEKYWANAFLPWAGTAIRPEALKTVASTMARKGARVDCAALSPRTLMLVRSGRAEAASILWQNLCANGHFTRAADFAFREDLGDGAPIGPFDWQYPEESGLDRSFTGSKAGTVLHYRNREPLRSVIAKRNALLAPGNYRARMDGAAHAEAGFRPIVLQIVCYAEDGTARRLGDAEMTSGSTDFFIPDTFCASQELVILSGRGEGEIGRLEIDPA